MLSKYKPDKNISKQLMLYEERRRENNNLRKLCRWRHFLTDIWGTEMYWQNIDKVHHFSLWPIFFCFFSMNPRPNKQWNLLPRNSINGIINFGAGRWKMCVCCFSFVEAKIRIRHTSPPENKSPTPSCPPHPYVPHTLMSPIPTCPWHPHVPTPSQRRI